MRVVAIIPLRSLHDGKQRLRGVLSPEARRSLVQHLFQRTRQALIDSGSVARVVVVSPDAALLDWVAAYSVWPIAQPGTGLNAGLEYARQQVLASDPDAVTLLVLPDLPFVRSDEIADLVRLGAPRTVVLAPDRHEQGTNMLLLPPRAVFPLRFGAASLQQHVIAATEAGLSVRLHRSLGTAFDLDTPDDWQHVAANAVISDASYATCEGG